MSKYIKLDDLLSLNQILTSSDEGGWSENVQAVLLEDIKEQPVLDIVRCRDCIYQFYNALNKRCCCRTSNNFIVSENDFCSFGKERRNKFGIKY